MSQHPLPPLRASPIRTAQERGAGFAEAEPAPFNPAKTTRYFSTACNISALDARIRYVI
jgi:hypothetical protein